MLEFARAQESDRKCSKVLETSAIVVLWKESTCKDEEKIKRGHSTIARRT